MSPAADGSVVEVRAPLAPAPGTDASRPDRPRLPPAPPTPQPARGNSLGLSPNPSPGTSPSPAAPSPSHGRMHHLGHALLGQRLSSMSATSTNEPLSDNGEWADAQSHLPQSPAPANEPTPAQLRWQALKRRLQTPKKARASAPSQVKAEPDLTQELSTAVLPVMLLKMGLERDENSAPRVPVLLNHLRIRVTDSLEAGAQAGYAVFRIELSYGDGLARWVIYREMRDFIVLQTHYRAASLRGRLGIKKPDGHAVGPASEETTLPALPKWKHTVFRPKDAPTLRSAAQAMRDQLQEWLVQICHSAVLRPDANRLCKFLEISALALALAGRPGVQGKQGFLNILSPISRKASHRNMAVRIAARNNQKWCLVRESYLIVAAYPGDLTVDDVFLFDVDFRITRPKRIYRQPLHHSKDPADGESDSSDANHEDMPARDQTGQDNSEKGRKDLAELIIKGQFTNMREGREIDLQHAHGVSAHTFYLINSHQKLKLVAHNQRQMNQFVASMQDVAKRNPFAGPNRFDSFAPIRLHVNAMPLIDGRDYYWALSKALVRAKDRIMIHDWWLSPELYLRRPGRPGFRLDTILRQKAEEGVKVFIILYNEVSNNFTPTDSNYSKQRLINLHKNIMVQRSPSHFQTGTFYWAHHEKMCVIDETIGFMGGFDLCFGRWDTHAHVLTDNVEADPDQTGVQYEFDDPRLIGPIRQSPDGPIEANVWPGQDYANERVKEWSVLNRPEEDLFPRDKYPRMPWHDVGMQLVGQPARDLARHFIQRWNYLLRIKNHTREMPFLLPPADFSAAELKQYGLTGTCEAQICRSAGPWSIGTPDRVEHSIQNAYLKAIENSEHFVYIENQFFITSTAVETTQIENHIGDALVDRILRAHRDGTPWRAIIVMPLVPGFPLPIDHPDASSVRIIVEGQYRSICRGKYSIFGRLQTVGIDPADYISFFGLRNWGRLKNGAITTEQVYIHGKLCIVDDRVVICGSANINERSQRGDRDSELAVVLRDTDLIDSTMAGKPFQVGRMPHQMRVRLMQEHVGVDVDALQAQAYPETSATNSSPQPKDPTEPDPTVRHTPAGVVPTPHLPMDTLDAPSGSVHDRLGSTPELGGEEPRDGPAHVTARRRKPAGRFALPGPEVAFAAGDFEDPLIESYYYDIWAAVAERNTLIYRRALRVVPDDTVKTWSEYKWFMSYTDRLSKAQEEMMHSANSAAASTTTAVDEGAPLPPSRGAQAGNKSKAPNHPPEGNEAQLPPPSQARANKREADNPAQGAQPLPPPGTAGGNRIDFTPEDISAIACLLESTQGHLVQFPTRWLEQESYSGQLLFASDTLMPLSIFF